MNQRQALINKRKNKGWLQQDAADELGISQQFISLIEQGKRDPSLILAKNMERIYESSMEELFPDIFLKTYTTKCNKNDRTT